MAVISFTMNKLVPNPSTLSNQLILFLSTNPHYQRDWSSFWSTTGLAGMNGTKHGGEDIPLNLALVGQARTCTPLFRNTQTYIWHSIASPLAWLRLTFQWCHIVLPALATDSAGRGTQFSYLSKSADTGTTNVLKSKVSIFKVLFKLKGKVYHTLFKLLL